MGRYINVHEALKILNVHYVTDSIQMVTRWIREGRILAERSENRKEGWRILEEDVYEFANEVNPGIVQLLGYYNDMNKIVKREIINKENSEIIHQVFLEKQLKSEPEHYLLEGKMEENEKNSTIRKQIGKGR